MTTNKSGPALSTHKTGFLTPPPNYPLDVPLVLFAAVLVLIFEFSIPFPLLAQTDAPTRRLSRDIFKQLIEINTTDSVGSTTVAAKAMAERLRNAGFPGQRRRKFSAPTTEKATWSRVSAARARTSPFFSWAISMWSKRAAKTGRWIRFEFIEKDGYFYGRGTQDMKSGDAILVTTLIRLKKENYRPDRDLILALTADEEGGKSNGVDWLLKNHRDLIDAEFALNADGGGIYTRDGKPVIVTVDASEKLYADYQLEVKNPGGHSSLPVPDNAIYHLTDALGRLERYKFPFELNAGDARLLRALRARPQTARFPPT